MTVQHGDTYDEFKRNVRIYGSRVTPLRGYSREIASQFTEQIDLLFIDGDHSYHGCLFDIQAWSPHLVRGATIIFHDYSWAGGVQRAICETIVPIQLTRGKIVHGTYWTTVDTHKN
jgi:predicted O-methyltransferase YrrM